ncbi:MAG: methyltransferase domain-containing protein, partial [Desulfobulbaceae bacterium]|nr:methyltransferase domain-containing protein [Desulfobulbaceae bacterium]
MTAAKQETVTIEKLVIGGRGLARLADGLVVLVDGVLPGERVLVRPLRKRGGYVEGELVELLAPSPLRVTPPCPHFWACGGCDLQHAEPASQVGFKEEILRDHLWRGPLFDADSLAAVWRAPLPSPWLFHYRQRIRLQIGNDFAPTVGFHRRRSHTLEPVASCMLAREEINAVLGQIDGCKPMAQLLGYGSELELLFSPADRDVVLLLHFGRKPRPADIKAAEGAVAALGARALLFNVDGFGLFGPVGNGRADDVLLRFALPGLGRDNANLVLTVEPGGFCQVNPEQNLNLIGQMLAWIGEGRPQRTLDCHCGIGNFSIPLAVIAGQVTGCDLQGAAIRSARRNAELNGIENCRFEKRAAV